MSQLAVAVEMKKKQKRGKNVVVATTRPNEQYLGSGGEENRSSTSQGPLWERVVLNVPLFARPVLR